MGKCLHVCLVLHSTFLSLCVRSLLPASPLPLFLAFSSVFFSLTCLFLIFFVHWPPLAWDTIPWPGIQDCVQPFWDARKAWHGVALTCITWRGNYHDTKHKGHWWWQPPPPSPFKDEQITNAGMGMSDSTAGIALRVPIRRPYARVQVSQRGCIPVELSRVVCAVA